jgi:hypothetical protein
VALGLILVALKEKINYLGTKSSRATANETDLYFLLTTGHAACLAANTFGSSSLGRVRSFRKGRCRIAGGRRLRAYDAEDELGDAEVSKRRRSIQNERKDSLAGHTISDGSGSWERRAPMGVILWDL